jgi:hypothetical protein
MQKALTTGAIAVLLCMIAAVQGRQVSRAANTLQRLPQDLEMQLALSACRQGPLSGRVALMASSAAAPRQQLSRGIRSMVPGQTSNHPVEPADHRLNRVLLLDLLSGCVPNVSLSTFEAGCPRREEIQPRPVA